MPRWRQFNIKVFKGIAEKGKGTMGCYVGFKLHLSYNEKGELIGFVLALANVDDRNESVIDALTDRVFGKLYGLFSDIFGTAADTSLPASAQI